MKSRLALVLCLFWLWISPVGASGDEVTFCSDSVLAELNAGVAIAPARVPKTGQTISYGARDDGKLEKGAIWPNPRFTDKGDGTVRDNLTGLLWLKNANCKTFYGGDSLNKNTRTWSNALSISNKLASGYCDLTDGSVAGQWRLPNVKELLSLIDYGCGGDFTAGLPDTTGTACYSPGDPFFGAQLGAYWSSTTVNGSPNEGLVVGLRGGSINAQKTDLNHVWPVRGPVAP